MSRLKKNWLVCFQPIKFEKIVDQPIRGVHFQKTPEFSQKLPNLSRNFSDTNQNNQSGRFPFLQEEELERQKSHKVNKNTLKLSTETWLNVFSEW